jgi:hypothetical protein
MGSPYFPPPAYNAPEYHPPAAPAHSPAASYTPRPTYKRSGGNIARQIEPTGAEPLAGGAYQSAAALLKNVAALAAYKQNGKSPCRSRELKSGRAASRGGTGGIATAFLCLSKTSKRSNSCQPVAH